MIAIGFDEASESIHLAPHLPTVNRSEFRQIDRQWEQAVRMKTVRVLAVPVDGADPGVPLRRAAESWINEGSGARTFRA